MPTRSCRFLRSLSFSVLTLSRTKPSPAHDERSADGSGSSGLIPTNQPANLCARNSAAAGLTGASASEALLRYAEMVGERLGSS